MITAGSQPTETIGVQLAVPDRLRDRADRHERRHEPGDRMYSHLLPWPHGQPPSVKHPCHRQVSLTSDDCQGGLSPCAPANACDDGAMDGSGPADQPTATTILPTAAPSSMARCASTIWSKPNTLTGLALYRPTSALAIMPASGIWVSGKSSVPSTKALP